MQVPSSVKVPDNWTKQSGTSVSCTPRSISDKQKVSRYASSVSREKVRTYQEAKETESAMKKSFYRRLLAEFDKDRNEWRDAVR